ncbi:hypothetical protein J3E69DRAFT_379601 [Trichoderma sp. SZMC 28015]
MTLEKAVDFVISFDNSESAAFGCQPDPVLCTKDLKDGNLVGLGILSEVRKLGWRDELLVGLRSRWVGDLEKCPKGSRWSRSTDRIISLWKGYDEEISGA